ncbi:MAG: hypothetical protein RIE03_21405 [Pseudomonadales bacterium]
MSGAAKKLRRVGLGATLGAVVLLRVLVPAGYMPAALAGGWFLQLCPDGLPVAAMQALLGEAHHHHHHHAPDNGASAGGDAVAMPEQCQLGAGFAAAATVETLPQRAPIPARHGQVRLPDAAVAVRRTASSFQPRAPPLLLG